MPSYIIHFSRGKVLASQSPDFSVNVGFIKALEKVGSRTRLWEDFRFLVRWCWIESWDVFYASILDPPQLYLKSA